MPLTWPELLAELRRADLLVDAPPQGPEPTALTADSRAVVPGSVYLAVRGSQTDGHRFVPDALRRGAAAVIVDYRGRIRLYQDPDFDISVQEGIDLAARLKQEVQDR